MIWKLTSNIFYNFYWPRFLECRWVRRATLGLENVPIFNFTLHFKKYMLQMALLPTLAEWGHTAGAGTGAAGKESHMRSNQIWLF